MTRPQNYIGIHHLDTGVDAQAFSDEEFISQNHFHIFPDGFSKVERRTVKWRYMNAKRTLYWINLNLNEVEEDVKSAVLNYLQVRNCTVFRQLGFNAYTRDTMTDMVNKKRTFLFS